MLGDLSGEVGDGGVGTLVGAHPEPWCNGIVADLLGRSVC